ncbi:hypothetical protein [Streptomyces chrestomyceticus]|uniref:hypothetical protein n=1 Tax=Streptomyces chrestomyceticus TaxID=68185 RepID=UPI0033C91FF9
MLGLVFLIGCPPGWWWGGDRANLPGCGRLLASLGRPADGNTPDIAFVVQVLGYGLLAVVAGLAAAALAALPPLALDLARGDDPCARYRHRTGR